MDILINETVNFELGHTTNIPRTLPKYLQLSLELPIDNISGGSPVGFD